MVAPGDSTEASAGDDRPLTGAERAVAALRDGIRRGHFVPGQRLVEVDLTRQIGVGRNSLREAFSRLRSEGLLVVEPHRGASIRRFTRDDVTGFYEMLEVLDGLTARRAAERIDRPGHAERLADAVRALEAAHRDSASVPGWDHDEIDGSARFHTCIADLADHPQLATLVDSLHLQTFIFELHRASRYGVADLRERALREHLAVAEQIAAGEPAKAEEAMQEHLRCLRDRFFALPDHEFG